MTETVIKSYPASRRCVWDTWKYFVYATPLALYAVPDSIHDIFGVDLTGGWMGDRDPVGAGHAVLAGLPIYVFGFLAGLQYFFIRPQAALTVTDSYIGKYFKWMLPKRKIHWGDIESVQKSMNEDGDEELVIIAAGNEHKIKSSFLLTGISDLTQEIEKRGFSISNEATRSV